MVRTLFVDMDGTLTDSWRRIRGHSFEGIQLESAYYPSNVLTDKPIDRAVDAINAFKLAGWQVVVLTARGFDVDGAITKEWLSLNKFPTCPVVIVNGAEDKIHHMITFGKDCDLFVDDFIGGYETGLPRFVTKTYEVCRKIIRTEPFRNNWPEIVIRYLNVEI